jgi:hypothetical protein
MRRFAQIMMVIVAALCLFATNAFPVERVGALEKVAGPGAYASRAGTVSSSAKDKKTGSLKKRKKQRTNVKPGTNVSRNSPKKAAKTNTQRPARLPAPNLPVFSPFIRRKSGEGSTSVE